MEKIGVFLRAPHNYDVDKASSDAALHPGDDGVTQQSFKDECDINVIVERFGLTGDLPNGVSLPQSGDFTGVVDFHTAMNVVRQAEEAFMLLPGETRARFNHDPQRLLDFVNDGRNRDEAIRLGIIGKPVEKPRDVVAAVDELAAKIAPVVAKAP